MAGMLPLKDELVEHGDGLTTIGHRRIICFPTITATKLRFIITDAKAQPVIKKLGVYLAPELTADIPDSGEKKSSALHLFLAVPVRYSSTGTLSRPLPVSAICLRRMVAMALLPTTPYGLHPIGFIGQSLLRANSRTSLITPLGKPSVFPLPRGTLSSSMPTDCIVANVWGMVTWNFFK